MLKLGYTILMVSVFMLLLACNKPIEYPLEPVISFSSINTLKYSTPIGNITDSIEVVVDFTDGDGDLGLPQGVNGDTSNYNLFYTSYKKSKGVWSIVKPIAPFKATTSYHIPTLNKSKKAKALKGKIKVDVSSAFSFFTAKDTLRLELYVKDNNGHISNTITTTEHVGLQ